MREARITRIMNTLMILGLLLILSAISMAVFAELQLSMGITGVLIITATFGIGLFILLPAKIYLTLMLMSREQDGNDQNSKD